MILPSEPRSPANTAPRPNSGTSVWPEGSLVQQIAFATKPISGQTVLFSLPAPLRHQVVALPSATTSADLPSATLSVLAIPNLSPTANGSLADECQTQMQQWVDSENSADESQAQWMTFQGTQICWGPTRCAILAPPERLEAVKQALLEVYFYESELRDIERSLGETWPELESDIPLAFEFQEQTSAKRQAIQQRFQSILLCRARLARLGPFIHGPYLHPPTLASQISERFRERTRLMHRHEFLEEQLEVFEHVYEMCGQRASDYKLAHTGHLLEWTIIVLLVAQLLLAGFELLTSIESASIQPTNAAAPVSP